MQLTDGLHWQRIYWLRGDTPRNIPNRNAVKDPPCSGWMHALVIDGPKRSTILCPYTVQAYTVPNSCGEIAGAMEPRESIAPDKLAQIITTNWEASQRHGWARDYDTAALVLRKLGAPVPAQVMKGGEEDMRTRGGKESAGKLLKPVKLASKRGKFLFWFLEGDGTQSVREAMAEFGMTRSNVLSYLYILQKDHGIGYALVGDAASLTMPECASPFDDGTPSPAAKKAAAPADDDTWLDGEDTPEEDDDSWLD